MNNIDIGAATTDSPGYMRLAEIAARYGLSRVQVQRAMELGKLPAKRVMVVRIEDVERFATHYLQPLPTGGYKVRRVPMFSDRGQE